MERQANLKNKLFTKAFTRTTGGSWSGVYTRDKGSLRAGGFPHSFILREILEPRLYLEYLQDAIRDLVEGRYRKALKLALKEYREMLLEMSRGCQCD